jgi:polyisoprenyl-teichoic acid--peptidoglycan teichoic acid transferase
MKTLNSFKNAKLGTLSLFQVIFWGIVLVFALGGFLFIRGIVSCWTITSLPGTTPSNCGTITSGLEGPVLNEEGTPVATDVAPPPPAVSIPESDLPPAWDGASRINVLLIGLDYRDWEAGLGAPRSDTMIVLTIDPLTKTAGMLTIPRDMWVNIPGFGYSRINTAYSSGEGAKLPGGGPALASKTVEQFLGVTIHYYAQIDFNAFVEFIDLIGGIDIHNDQELRLDPVGSGKDKIKLTCCGMRHLNGEKTLAYVRYRKDKEGDVARSKRQIKVILAIRDKVLAPENFPVLLGKARQFYEEFSAGIKTNMQFDTALQLGVLARDIPVDSIKQGVIDYTMVALDSTQINGVDASIMKPLPDKIRILRDEVFTVSGPVSPLAILGDPTALMKADGARVRLLNGSFSPGLEVNTGNYFLGQGMAVTEVGAADRAYDRTVIVLHGPKLYTLKYLQAVFGISSSTQIVISPDPASAVDIDVFLGNDWANSNPMP